jgi:hypothetical protein
MLTAYFSLPQGIEIFQSYACHRLLKAVAPLTIREPGAVEGLTTVLTSFTGTAWFLARDADVTLSSGHVIKQNVPTAIQFTNATLTGTVPNSTGGADTGRLHVLGIDTATPIAADELIGS